MGDRDRPPAVRALRRPAAARRGRARDRHQPGADPRRRADRQPRLALHRRRARRSSRASTTQGRTVVMITHEADVAAHAKRVIRLGRRARSSSDERTGVAAAVDLIGARDAARSRSAGVAANKLRSGLTILGMTIGVASVIVLIAVGNGSSKAVQSQIERSAPTCCSCRRGGARGGRGARRRRSEHRRSTEADAEALENPIKAPDVKSASPVVNASGTTLVDGSARATNPRRSSAPRPPTPRRTTTRSPTGACSPTRRRHAAQPRGGDRPDSRRRNCSAAQTPSARRCKVDGTQLPSRRRDRGQGLQRHPATRTTS